MMRKSTIDRKRRAFDKYFGEDYELDDLFGITLFNTSYEDLSSVAEKYKKWYRSEYKPSIYNVPEDLMDVYRVHRNFSKENQSRIELGNKLTGLDLDLLEGELLKRRSIMVPVDDINAALLAFSSIYRGRDQVDVGNYFENKVLDAVSSIPGVTYKKNEVDGINCDLHLFKGGKNILSLEISFQVTTNSTMERKSNLHFDRPVAFVFGGLGWIERINALERIESGEGYCAVFGPTESELNRLKKYVESLF